MFRLRLLAASAATALAGLGVALWPLHANGVTGNAVAPRYQPFGWYAYQPVPARPTTADLRRAGVPVPQDAVSDRRRLAAGLVGAGLVLAVGSVFFRARLQP